jgi:hypothetical protein
MRQLVESLKRLYEQGKVTKDKLAQMVKENKITQEEFNFIING